MRVAVGHRHHAQVLLPGLLARGRELDVDVGERIGLGNREGGVGNRRIGRSVNLDPGSEREDDFLAGGDGGGVKLDLDRPRWAAGNDAADDRRADRDEGRGVEAGEIDEARVAELNDRVVAEFLADMDQADLPTTVRMKMIELLPSGECDRERIASLLNMTVRTMHNKLDSAGTSYQQLLDDTREELAREYMQKKQLSVSEIAYMLGYTDLSSFSRAFKRWTGQSPRAYLKSVS